ncbi:MAG: SGNH/GDSL hydrolase family protein [Solirubrobacteraceae bacterium]
MIALTAAAPQAVASDPVPTPRSMAALGDSLTVGQGAGSGGSWSTGTKVNSHYSRLNAWAPGVKVANYAEGGKKVSALDGQAKQAVAARAEYVTILIGTNDVCKVLTSESAFRGSFQAAMNTLTSGSNTTRIFVASIPNWHYLYDLYRDNPSALSKSVERCPNLVAANPSPEAKQRLVDFNGVLAEECAGHRKCVFDGNAVYNNRFKLADYSTLDYFHFSTQGQAALAELTFPLAFPGTMPPPTSPAPPPTAPPPPPPPTSTPSPPPPLGCALKESFTGSLSRPGAVAFKPGSSFKTTTSGTHHGCLRGPESANFDLYLERRDGSLWTPVAESISPTSSESVTAAGPAGTYRWQIVSRSGSGSYTFGLTRPS